MKRYGMLMAEADEVPTGGGAVAEATPEELEAAIENEINGAPAQEADGDDGEGAAAEPIEKSASGDGSAMDAVKAATESKRKAERDAVLDQAAQQILKQQQQQPAGTSPTLPTTDAEFLTQWRGDTEKLTVKNPDVDDRGDRPTLTLKELRERPEYEPLVELLEQQAVSNWRAGRAMEDRVSKIEQRAQAEQQAAADDKFYSEMETRGHAGIRTLDTKALGEFAGQQDEGYRELLASNDPADVDLALRAFYEAKNLPLPDAGKTKEQLKSDKRASLAKHFEGKKKTTGGPAGNRVGVQMDERQATPEELDKAVDAEMNKTLDHRLYRKP